MRSETALVGAAPHTEGSEPGFPDLGMRRYGRILGYRVDEPGLDRVDHGKHSMRRTKATSIHRRTRNLRAVQWLLGRSKLESTLL